MTLTSRPFFCSIYLTFVALISANRNRHFNSSLIVNFLCRHTSPSCVNFRYRFNYQRRGSDSYIVSYSNSSKHFRINHKLYMITNCRAFSMCLCNDNATRKCTVISNL